MYWGCETLVKGHKSGWEWESYSVNDKLLFEVLYRCLVDERSLVLEYGIFGELKTGFLYVTLHQ